MTLTPLPANVQAAVDAARRLPHRFPGIVAIGLVGSWAREAGRPDSDVDLVVLTDEPRALLDNLEWRHQFDAGARLVSARDFGALQERRLRCRDGLEIEVGIGTPGWARTRPVDPGTATVVRDGLVAVYDPQGRLAALAAAVT